MVPQLMILIHGNEPCNPKVNNHLQPGSAGWKASN